jgi:hypothetical protein
MTGKPTTFHQLAIAETLSVGGRFAGLRGKVVGAMARYPSASPHQGADQAVEPPLGYDVSAVEPVGSAAEIEASLRSKDDERSTDDDRRVRSGDGSATTPRSD